MMTQIMAVAVGGAIGAVGRFLLVSAMGRWIGHGFPYGTLSVNILGSLAMGLLVALLAAKGAIPIEVRAFFAVGFLGAFTTFSTFSLDMITLIERQNWEGALGYLLASVFLSIGALFCGLRLGRLVFS